jgi:hypothetical protein
VCLCLWWRVCCVWLWLRHGWSWSWSLGHTTSCDASADPCWGSFGARYSTVPITITVTTNLLHVAWFVEHWSSCPGVAEPKPCSRGTRRLDALIDTAHRASSSTQHLVTQLQQPNSNPPNNNPPCPQRTPLPPSAEQPSPPQTQRPSKQTPPAPLHDRTTQRAQHRDTSTTRHDTKHKTARHPLVL